MKTDKNIRISCDFDDFSPLNHRFDLLDNLRERYPDFKVTLFTVPWEIRFSPDTKGTPITDERYSSWCQAVRQAVEDGWMQVAIHGLTHAPEEFEDLTYDEAKKRVIVAQKMFANAKIPIIPYFKAPQWLLSRQAKKGIEELGITVVEDNYYNWNLKDQIPKKDLLIAHGHVQDEMSTLNGMEQSFMRLCKVPSNAEWVFLKNVL